MQITRSHASTADIIVCDLVIFQRPNNSDPNQSRQTYNHPLSNGPSPVRVTTWYHVTDWAVVLPSYNGLKNYPDYNDKLHIVGNFCEA